MSYRVKPEEVAQVFIDRKIKLALHSFFHEFEGCQYGCLLTGVYLSHGYFPQTTGYGLYEALWKFGIQIGMTYEYCFGFTYGAFNPSDISSAEYELGREDRSTILRLLREAGLTNTNETN